RFAPGSAGGSARDFDSYASSSSLGKRVRGSERAEGRAESNRETPMRRTMAMLAVLSLAGCGHESGNVEEGQTEGTAAAERPDVGEASSALRIGRRRPVISARVRRSLAAGAERLSDLQADRIGDNARN